jgi:transcriptional regulator with XRE-family HTH domain
MTSEGPSAEQRQALGSFLVSRRAVVQPSDVGLPVGRRRTPGLRREEVALLAGVSVSWYTWLEQGRDIRASAATLRRLAEVLRLDRAEVVLLFALATQLAPPHESGEEVSEGLARLVEAINPVAAYIRNARLDILAWNHAVTELFLDYGALEPSERNTLRLMFLHPPYRTLIVNWEEIARGTLEQFRIARAQAEVKDPFDELAEGLLSESPEFRKWWPDLDVQMFTEGTKILEHPTLGSLELSYNALAPQGRPYLSLVTYVPRPI